MNPDADSPRERGRRLWAEAITAEQKLWCHLRAKRFAGFKFHRPHRW
jgi:very-short-patch-repair endonuclease